ncbi:MAG: hypothetical protein ACHQQQ_08155 [Bacteroidota bacterium]
MNNSEFIEIQHYTISRLTALWILSGRLNHLFGEKAQELTKNLESVSNDVLLQEKDLADEAANCTIREIMELKIKDPQRVEQIYRQIALKFKTIILPMEIELYGQSYPILTLSAMAIMAFAMFEQGIALFCDVLGQISKTKVKLNDINGHSTIDKAQSYLVKVIEINYDFSQSIVWSRIKGHQAVRNLLVHNLGLLDDSERTKLVRTFIDRSIPGLSIIDGSLKIQFEYIEELVKDYQYWLEEIYDSPKLKELKL